MRAHPVMRGRPERYRAPSVTRHLLPNWLLMNTLVVGKRTKLFMR